MEKPLAADLQAAEEHRAAAAEEEDVENAGIGDPVVSSTPRTPTDQGSKGKQVQCFVLARDLCLLFVPNGIN